MNFSEINTIENSQPYSSTGNTIFAPISKNDTERKFKKRLESYVNIDYIKENIQKVSDCTILKEILMSRKNAIEQLNTIDKQIRNEKDQENKIIDMYKGILNHFDRLNGISFDDSDIIKQADIKVYLGEKQQKTIKKLENSINNILLQKDKYQEIVDETEEIFEIVSKFINSEVIDKRYTCKICYKNPIDQILKDCGHTFCKECLDNVKKCPMCDGNVENVSKIYFA